MRVIPIRLRDHTDIPVGEVFVQDNMGIKAGLDVKKCNANGSDTFLSNFITEAAATLWAVNYQDGKEVSCPHCNGRGTVRKP